MTIDAKTVKALRDQTGAGMMDCKKALVETNGDIKEALDYLRKTGIAKAEWKGQREAREGIVFSYIHHGARLGVLVELNCETDFVAKTEGFQNLAHDIAMQIAATNPLAVGRNDLAPEVVTHEKEIYSEQARSAGKPNPIIDKVVNGRLEKFFQEVCLLEQPFIKDPERRIQDLLTEAVATLGENIQINRFTRYAVGEASSNSQHK